MALSLGVADVEIEIGGGERAGLGVGEVGIGVDDEVEVGPDVGGEIDARRGDEGLGDGGGDALDGDLAFEGARRPGDGAPFWSSRPATVRSALSEPSGLRRRGRRWWWR